VVFLRVSDHEWLAWQRQVRRAKVLKERAGLNVL
jgi:hypothetical protein